VYKIKSSILLLALFLMTFAGSTSATFAAAPNVASCKSSVFFGLPTWYKYLKSEEVKEVETNRTYCQPVIEGIDDFAKIILAIIDMLIIISGIIAVVFVIYGGVSYILSQGDDVSGGGRPAKTAKAQSTVINALVGVAISVSAAAIVNYLGRSIS
jgi:hypothetical protein